MQVLKSQINAATINEYLNAIEVEINPSKNYRNTITNALNYLSQFHKGKPYSIMKRDDIVAFLNSVKKSNDPSHRWIGTYNLYLMHITKFFRWFYSPNLEPKQRPKPEVVQNIPNLKRKETSIYKPTDLWTLEDDLLFLKWCPNKRDRCYHAISRDLSARPHEILSLHINDLIFKQIGDKQYAEVLVNGKTGTRHLPLIDSLPYVKDWLDQHPQRNNKNAYLVCSLDRRNYCKQLGVISLHGIYRNYKVNYFSRLIKDSTVSNEEKRHIKDLLLKPWNPYIRRHSALTEKSKFLRESTLRQHAGWSGRSQMHLKYVHYFGNESNNSILQEYGILPKDNEEIDVLKPKQCPNCNEPNKPDSRFCAKCRMVLTYDAYSETLEKQQEKESEIQKLREKQEQDMRLMREEMEIKFQQILAKIDVGTLK